MAEVVDAKANEAWPTLLALFQQLDWGTNVDHLTAALKIIRAHPTVIAVGHANQWDIQDDDFRKGWPLRTFLPYHPTLTVDDLDFLLDLHPIVLKELEFLHVICNLPGVRKDVIQFFAQQCPDAIRKTTVKPISDMVGVEEYPLSLYWNQCCLRQNTRPVPLEEASTDYWEEVRQVCDILWMNEKDDFVDPAVERECWPLVSYFVSKKPKLYWAQIDPEEAWKHSPPYGTISEGALDVISKILLPNFKRQAFELELPTSGWEDRIVPTWIQNHPDLRLLYLNSKDETLDWVPPQTTDAIFNGLAKNQSLVDFRMSGQFQASWNAFANVLRHAPRDFLVCNLLIVDPTTTMDMEPSTIPTQLSPNTSSLHKLDLFRIVLNPVCYDHLIKLLVTMPSLEHLELVIESPDELYDQGLDHNVATQGMISLLKKERLKKLVFGPFALAVEPMCKLLKDNRTLESLTAYLEDDKKKDGFKQLVETMRENNQTLKYYKFFEYGPAPTGVDTTMAGFRTDIVFCTCLNRMDYSLLGQPQATINTLIDALAGVRAMAAQDAAAAALNADEVYFEESYCYELLQQRPSLWARSSLGQRGLKRKYSA